MGIVGEVVMLDMPERDEKLPTEGMERPDDKGWERCDWCG